MRLSVFARSPASCPFLGGNGLLRHVLQHCSRSYRGAAIVLCLGSALSATASDDLPALDSRPIEQVIVTGTRIQKQNLISVSPITQLDSRDIRLSGQTRLEDVLKNLPQLYSQDNTNVSNESTGIATISLRNLGAVRTLVLVDGRRLPQGSPYRPGSADINQIPAGLLERVEVLTAGASAVYGSDAMAGVVNFLLMDDFDGVKLDYQFSQYSHDNNNGSMKRRLAALGESAPSGTDRDGDTHDLSLILGRNFDADRGNLTGYLTYRDIDPILQRDRDYSACILRAGDEGLDCQLSPMAEDAHLQGFPGLDVMVQGDEFVPHDGRGYNYAPLNFYQRRDERWTAGLLGRFEFSERLSLYGQFMYMDDDTLAQIAPSGSYGAVVSLNCDNPMLSEQQTDALCGSLGPGSGGSRRVDVWRRSVESRPRTYPIEHESMRFVTGIEGKLNPTWRYDLYALYSEVDMDARFSDEFLFSKVERALDAVIDPVSGDLTCRSVINGSDPACHPWNIFSAGAVSPESVDYLATTIADEGTTEQIVVSGYLAANLAEYGLVSPFASTGIDWIVGAEYRDEDLERTPDALARSGDVIGWEFPRQQLRGGYDVRELYTELSLPLVEGKPWADSLVLDLGYRYSDYSEWDSSDTYKIGVSWAPTASLRFRGSYQRAERVPNAAELFSREVEAQRFGFVDPCGGTAPSRSLEECAYTGVTAEQYGSIPTPIFPYVNFVEGGNEALQPEQSDTYSVGFLYSPPFLAGVSFSLDWYEIKIDNTINDVGVAIVLDQCMDTGDASICSLVNRDPELATLWRDGGFIDARKQNLAYVRTRGYDFLLDASFDLGQAGSLLVSNTLTYLDEFVFKGTSAAIPIDCDGKYHGGCSPMPEVRNHLRLNWVTPWEVTLSSLWRHFDEIENYDNPDETISSFDYLDLALTWDLKDNAQLRLGINNVFDEDPPFITNFSGAWGLYDTLGQYWFAGVTMNF